MDDDPEVARWEMSQLSGVDDELKQMTRELKEILDLASHVATVQKNSIDNLKLFAKEGSETAAYISKIWGEEYYPELNRRACRLGQLCLKYETWEK